MVNNTRIIEIQSILIGKLNLVILKTKFLPLVTMMAVVQKTIKWNYLISVQIHGQRKLHFFSAHLSKSVFLYVSGHMLSVYLVMELSVANHQYLSLEDGVIIQLLL